MKLLRTTYRNARSMNGNEEKLPFNPRIFFSTETYHMLDEIDPYLVRDPSIEYDTECNILHIARAGCAIFLNLGLFVLEDCLYEFKPTRHKMQALLNSTTVYPDGDGLGMGWKVRLAGTRTIEKGEITAYRVRYPVRYSCTHNNAILPFITICVDPLRIETTLYHTNEHGERDAKTGVRTPNGRDIYEAICTVNCDWLTWRVQ